jgi:hypothetical protein
MGQGPAEAVELPDDQAVAGAQLVQQLLQDRPVGAGAAGRLDKDRVAAGALEGVDLELGVLAGGGDAGVAEQRSHAAERRTTLWQQWLCDVDWDTGSGHRQTSWRRGSGGSRTNGRF